MATPRHYEDRHLCYEHLTYMWELCTDCYNGAPLIKSPEKLQVYLPPSKRELDDYNATQSAQLYQFRYKHAVYENIFKPVVDDCVGIMQKNAPIIKFGVNDNEESEKEVRDIVTWGTKYNDGLKGLKWRVNHNQALYGRYGMLLDIVVEDDLANKKKGHIPRFVITEYPAQSILEGSETLPRVGGWGTTEWVRLDESYMGYDKKTKIWTRHERYRILGLDGRGYYYQAVFDGDRAKDWRNIDFDDPAASLPTELVYPKYKGTMLRFIPFTVCNVTKIGYNNWQYPPFLDVAYTAIGMYQVDSIYKKALWNHATPTLVVCNVDAKDDKNQTLFIGDALLLNSNSTYEARASLMETSGNGMAEMRAAKNEAKQSLKYQSLRDLLDDAGSNSSGSAIQLRTTSGTASISAIDVAGALAIEEQLIYASIWSGATPDEAGERISYRANTSYLNSEDQLQSLVSLFTANEQTKDGRPILSRRNKYNLLKSRFPFGLTSYEDNEAQIDADQEMLEEKGFTVTEAPEDLGSNQNDADVPTDADGEKKESDAPKSDEEPKEDEKQEEEDVKDDDESGDNEKQDSDEEDREEDEDSDDNEKKRNRKNKKK